MRWFWGVTVAHCPELCDCCPGAEVGVLAPGPLHSWLPFPFPFPFPLPFPRNCDLLLFAVFCGGGLLCGLPLPLCMDCLCRSFCSSSFVSRRLVVKSGLGSRVELLCPANCCLRISCRSCHRLRNHALVWLRNSRSSVSTVCTSKCIAHSAFCCACCSCLSSWFRLAGGALGMCVYIFRSFWEFRSKSSGGGVANLLQKAMASAWEGRMVEGGRTSVH